MAKPTERLRSFAELVQSYPGFTLILMCDLERRIADYDEAHQLRVEGYHLMYLLPRCAPSTAPWPTGRSPPRRTC
jgi:hypothetical protein